ncbi:SRPBCC domain-containing protein [Paenibacillus motobuensis]|uniref:Activator of Hsp90 ATPase homologue 1/2-like C-terminal domain-containing protein n=1 Tax=Paenibacillus motobuensis TaxID=295324 RepID=A0ABN0YDP6_9BACL
MSEGQALVHSVVIHAPVHLVWHAWTISSRVTEWFAPQAIVEAREGGPYELYFIPGNTRTMNTSGCKVVKLIAEQELQFTWKAPDQFAAIMNDESHLTVVKVNLKEIDGESTEVTVEHTGFQDHPAWREAVQWHDTAWFGVLNSLKSAMENGQGELCCKP